MMENDYGAVRSFGSSAVCLTFVLATLGVRKGHYSPLSQFELRQERTTDALTCYEVLEASLIPQVQSPSPPCVCFRDEASLSPPGPVLSTSRLLWG